MKLGNPYPSQRNGPASGVNVEPSGQYPIVRKEHGRLNIELWGPVQTAQPLLLFFCTTFPWMFMFLDEKSTGILQSIFFVIYIMLIVMWGFLIAIVISAGRGMSVQFDTVADAIFMRGKRVARLSELQSIEVRYETPAGRDAPARRPAIYMRFNKPPAPPRNIFLAVFLRPDKMSLRMFGKPAESLIFKRRLSAEAERSRNENILATAYGIAEYAGLPLGIVQTAGA